MKNQNPMTQDTKHGSSDKNKEEIKTTSAATDIPAEWTEGPELPKVIDNPTDFQMAVGKAQMSGVGYVEVSERMFHFLTAGKETKYLHYGNPGIRVYMQGTRERYEIEDEQVIR